MPTYDYLCEACGHRFEQFQSMTAKTLRKCPACKKSKLERLIGAGSGVIFKGSGFYQTDYRSSSYSADAKADSAAKPDAKPDAKQAPACAPACGTDQAPSGCKMPKTKKKD